MNALIRSLTLRVRVPAPALVFGYVRARARAMTLQHFRHFTLNSFRIFRMKMAALYFTVILTFSLEIIIVWPNSHRHRLPTKIQINFVTKQQDIFSLSKFLLPGRPPLLPLGRLVLMRQHEKRRHHEYVFYFDFGIVFDAPLFDSSTATLCTSRERLVPPSPSPRTLSLLLSFCSITCFPY